MCLKLGIDTLAASIIVWFGVVIIQSASSKKIKKLPYTVKVKHLRGMIRNELRKKPFLKPWTQIKDYFYHDLILEYITNQEKWTCISE